MSIIDPLPIEEIEDTDLKKMLEQCEELQAPDTLFLQILGHVPEYAKALFKAMYMSHAEGNVDHRLKEIIRIQLARTAKDPYFSNLRSQMAKDQGLTEERIDAGCGDFENDNQFSQTEKWALRYAYLMYREPHKINKSFYEEGKKHYSEAQIMELGGFIALHYGMQVFMSTLKVSPLDHSNKNLPPD